MNKVILAIALCLAASISVKSQTVSDADKAALEQLNRRVIEASRTGNFDEAATLARQTLDLTVKVFGNNSEDTAIAYFNLGEIYRAKKDYEKAIENLEKALAIYRQDENKFGAKIANTARGLGLAHSHKKRDAKAEQYFLLAIAAAEKAYGKESREILSFREDLLNFYIFREEFDKAEALFPKLYFAAAKIFHAESREVEQIEDDYICFAVNNFSLKSGMEKIKKFRDAIDKPYQPAVKSTNDLTAEQEASAAAGIVNSLAITLIRPEYPSAARAVRAGGMIPVKITIDETGRVVRAQTFCGHPALRSASEQAALKSIFLPFLTEGEPTKVIGYVLYNFITP